MKVIFTDSELELYKQDKIDAYIMAKSRGCSRGHVQKALKALNDQEIEAATLRRIKGKGISIINLKKEAAKLVIKGGRVKVIAAKIGLTDRTIIKMRNELAELAGMKYSELMKL